MRQGNRALHRSAHARRGFRAGAPLHRVSLEARRAARGSRAAARIARGATPAARTRTAAGGRLHCCFRRRAARQLPRSARCVR